MNADIRSESLSDTSEEKRVKFREMVEGRFLKIVIINYYCYSLTKD